MYTFMFMKVVLECTMDAVRFRNHFPFASGIPEAEIFGQK